MARKRSNRRKNNRNKQKSNSAVSKKTVAPTDNNAVAVVEKTNSENDSTVSEEISSELKTTSKKRRSRKKAAKATSTKNNSKIKSAESVGSSVETREPEDACDLIDNVDSLIDELDSQETETAVGSKKNSRKSTGRRKKAAKKSTSKAEETDDEKTESEVSNVIITIADQDEVAAIEEISAEEIKTEASDTNVDALLENVNALMDDMESQDEIEESSAAEDESCSAEDALDQAGVEGALEDQFARESKKETQSEIVSQHADLLARLDKATRPDEDNIVCVDSDASAIDSKVLALESPIPEENDSSKYKAPTSGEVHGIEATHEVGSNPIQASALVEREIDAMIERFELTSHRMVTQLNEKINLTLERWCNEFAVLRQMTDPSANDESEGLGWEERRQKLMQAYGETEELDPKTDDADESNVEDSVEEPEAVEPAETNLVDTLEFLDETQSEKIAELKADLTSKLREAEIELSINRAKLSQQRATLEQKQVEIERRESHLRKKFVEMESAKKKGGFFDRWTRHLTFRKKKEIADLESTLFNCDDDENATEVLNKN